MLISLFLKLTENEVTSPHLKNNQISWEDFLKSTTLSSSGWRRIFSPDGDPKGLDKKLNIIDTKFLLNAAEVISDYFKRYRQNPQIALARDTRPTGLAISEIFNNIFIKKNIKFFDWGIITLPQCAAAVKGSPELSGFVYISASHNPPGYNGIKLGNHNGEVITASVNQKLVRQLKNRLMKEAMFSAAKFPSSRPSTHVEIIDSGKHYRDSLLGHFGYSIKKLRPQFQSMVKNITAGDYAIGCDFNGSARIKSIDKDFIRELGFRFLSINSTIGKFAHDIVPEQKSLNHLKEKMAGEEWEKREVLFGYTVDCDGDRGNIVVNARRGKKNQPLAPDAQTTFALAVLAELCFYRAFFPSQISKVTIVANGPTSLRIDVLAEKFGVKLVRAEVGEANVVSLAKKLRREGRLTPVMGEGSNGGSIIYPAVVRDPLAMVTSLTKLLFMGEGDKSLRHIAVEVLGCPKKFKQIPPQYFLGELIPYINTHTSTSVFEPAALLRVNCSTQKEFKKLYETMWLEEWENNKSAFDSWGIDDYKILNYEGIHTYPGPGNRHGSEDGGHKISLFNDKGVEVGFIWFRFSKTEPVLRLSAEHQDLSLQKKLFLLQKTLLLKSGKKDQGFQNL